MILGVPYSYLCTFIVNFLIAWFSFVSNHTHTLNDFIKVFNEVQRSIFTSTTMLADSMVCVAVQGQGAGSRQWLGAQQVENEAEAPRKGYKQGAERECVGHQAAGLEYGAQKLQATEPCTQ